MIVILDRLVLYADVAKMKPQTLFSTFHTFVLCCSVFIALHAPSIYRPYYRAKHTQRVFRFAAMLAHVGPPIYIYIRVYILWFLFENVCGLPKDVANTTIKRNNIIMLCMYTYLYASDITSLVYYYYKLWNVLFVSTFSLSRSYIPIQYICIHI